MAKAPLWARSPSNEGFYQYPYKGKIGKEERKKIPRVKFKFGFCKNHAKLEFFYYNNNFR
jgi:hypothetical protein